MEQKVALITGAARGIGLGTTHLFIELGWRVAMIDRDGDELRAASRDIANAKPFEYDVSIPEQVDCMIDDVLTEFGQIDAVVNNAGVADFLPVGETDFAAWRRIMENQS